MSEVVPISPCNPDRTGPAPRLAAAHSPAPTALVHQPGVRSSSSLTNPPSDHLRRLVGAYVATLDRATSTTRNSRRRGRDRDATPRSRLARRLWLYANSSITSALAWKNCAMPALPVAARGVSPTTTTLSDSASIISTAGRTVTETCLRPPGGDDHLERTAQDGLKFATPPAKLFRREGS